MKRGLTHLSVVTVTAIAAMSFLPTPAAAQFSRPGAKQQIRIGEKAADDLRREEKVLPDTDPRVIMLRRVASNLLSTLHDQEPWHFSFDVIDSKDINAFALPGGPTFFFRGLMDKLKTEDELAGVLAHELTHVRKQHWSYEYAAQARRDLLINLGLIFTKANRDVSQAAGVMDDVAFNLPFSRNEEKQADDGGFDLMIQAGYNPSGMAHVFQLLQDTARSSEPAPFLSDHPTDASRIKHIQDRIAASQQNFPPEKPLNFSE